MEADEAARQQAAHQQADEGAGQTAEEAMDVSSSGPILDPFWTHLGDVMMM